MVHEDYKQMIAAQALNALDDREASELAAHLIECADCRAELDEWQQTAAFIALDAAPREPSPQVRAQLLEQLKVEPTAESNNKKATVVTMPARRETSWSSLQRWGSIAAAVAIVALGITLFALWRQNLRVKRQLVEMSAEMEKTRKELEAQRETASILSAPGARLMELNGTEMAPNARATLAYDQTGRAMLLTRALPPPPAGKAYQLWFISGGKKMPGRVFTTNSSGEGTLKDQIPGQAVNSSIFAITLEPETGVAEPTGQIYLVSRS